MNNLLSITLVLVAFLSWALADAISVALYRKNSTGLVIINTTIGRLIIWALLLPFFWQGVHQITLTPLIFNLIAGLSSGVGLYFFGRSVRLANPAVVTPISSGWGASALILSRLFFNESISITQSVSIAIIFIGFIITIFQPGLFQQLKTQHTKGIVYAFLAFLVWGICGVTIKIPSVSYGWYWTSVILLIPYVVVIFIDSKNVFVENKTLKVSPLGILVLVVIFSALADIGYSGSFVAGGSNAIIGTIGGSYTALSTILMYFFYKEPMTKQQTIGTIISILGIIFTAFFSSI